MLCLESWFAFSAVRSAVGGESGRHLWCWFELSLPGEASDSQEEPSALGGCHSDNDPATEPLVSSVFVPLFSGKILSKALLQVWSGGGSQAVFVEISAEFDCQQTKGKTKSFLPVLFTWNRVGRDTAKIQFLFSSTFLCVTELWLPGNQNITELSIFCSRQLSLSLLLNLDVGF